MNDKRYVLGFMFDEKFERVALIRKNRPAWQAGKLNGVGGHIEMGEGIFQAVAREFKEETGYQTKLDDWTYFAHMHGNNAEGHFTIDIFATVGPLEELKDMTDERLALKQIRLVTIQDDEAVENIPWLVGLAHDVLKDGRPKFVEVRYPL